MGQYRSNLPMIFIKVGAATVSIPENGAIPFEREEDEEDEEDY